MREPRNPFRLRASEAIESDTTFLKLFGPGMLDLLPEGTQLWDKLQIFRSAPGAGKSSLLRLFTPSVLLTLHAFRRSEDLKELYQRMSEMGVVDEDGPRLLGVFHSCARNYATLEELEFDSARKERLLFGLSGTRELRWQRFAPPWPYTSSTIHRTWQELRSEVGRYKRPRVCLLRVVQGWS